jgi:hypothetical protein
VIRTLFAAVLLLAATLAHEPSSVYRRQRVRQVRLGSRHGNLGRPSP